MSHPKYDDLMSDTFLHLFGLTVDFKHDSTVNLENVNKASIDKSLGYKPETPATTEDYTEALQFLTF